MNEKTLGVYVHVPFCVRKCAYCDFCSQTGGDGERDAYLRAVVSHIREASGFTGNYTADSIYIGGGTPTVLGYKRLTALLNELKKRFTLSNNPEITVEANPGTVDPKTLKKLRKAGFNRLSLGVQSLDDRELAELGRVHNAEQAVNAVSDARAAGFTNISVDILYGLPSQTAAGWEETVRGVLALKPEHISCYGLKVEENTPLFERSSALKFPDDGEQADQYLTADGILTAAGYRHYEISNFALPGFESRHNVKYWTLKPYIGFGPSAHSDFDGKRYSVVSDLGAYVKGIADGGEVLRDVQSIPQAERAGEYIMLNLRTDKGVSSNEYTRLFRASFDAAEERLVKFEKHALAERAGDRWRLTPKGFLVSNLIIGNILEVPVETAPNHL